MIISFLNAHLSPKPSFCRQLSNSSHRFCTSRKLQFYRMNLRLIRFVSRMKYVYDAQELVNFDIYDVTHVSETQRSHGYITLCIQNPPSLSPPELYLA